MFKPISLAALALAATAAANHAGAAAFASSGAFSLSASFISEGSATGIAPVDVAQGTVAKPYNVQSNLNSFTQTAGIAAGKLQVGSVTTTATALRSHTQSSGLGVDSLSTEADGSLGSVQMSLQLYPPPPSAGVEPPIPLPLINVSASTVYSSVSESRFIAFPPVVSGSSGANALLITGTLLGGQKVSANGPAAPNTVAFSNASVTVTLNQQITAGAVSCNGACAFSPSGITTSAIAIHLDNASIGGHLVTGDILIGVTQSQF